MCATCFSTASSAVGAAAALGLPGVAAITVGRLTLWRERGDGSVDVTGEERSGDVTDVEACLGTVEP